MKSVNLSLLILMKQFESYFDLQEINTTRKVNAAVVNVSGRQRMLSQRTAFFSLKLVTTSDPAEREVIRETLIKDITLMERSHKGLLYGDSEMNLLTSPSAIVRSMYFREPLNLDKRIREYILAVRTLATTADSDLTPSHPHLDYITNIAPNELLSILDAVVAQYQRESEIEQLDLEQTQIQLYQQACSAAAIAQAQAQQLEQTLEELKHTNSQLFQSEKMASLGQMMASLAHEINNPVNSIFHNLAHVENYSKDLLELTRLYQDIYSPTDPRIQEYIDSIDLEFLETDFLTVISSLKLGSDRLFQIVRSLRNFSRKDSDQMLKVNLEEGLEGTLLILKNRLQATPSRPPIQVIRDYGKLPSILCYPGQLNQVFMNLISNAIDALDEVGDWTHNNQQSQPLITIKTLANSEQITIMVADNAKGINLTTKNQIFEQFFTTKEIGKGTGLGLYISREIIVSRHCGEIWCESEIGKGTEFWIKLPLNPQCPDFLSNSPISTVK
ncbi:MULTISPECIES: ATP-binding protein [Limnospira]|nr:ATP-binding protein [Limnospira indica]RAQ46718.1 GHKL domain-containing protein [Arthrospira sp. O9.13F]